ncbi:hypothetical protein M513_13244 [Trichuris suis]|uniref:Uncharacterized protein n=1 Tax=Trichuris suis TaxID=68888 RepID=A0A085LLN3_9BILA|nr:hypothetical protein M513_13244 [Trichuris suis]
MRKYHKIVTPVRQRVCDGLAMDNNMEKAEPTSSFFSNGEDNLIRKHLNSLLMNPVIFTIEKETQIPINRAVSICDHIFLSSELLHENSISKQWIPFAPDPDHYKKQIKPANYQFKREEFPQSSSHIPTE